MDIFRILTVPASVMCQSFNKTSILFDIIPQKSYHINCKGDCLYGKEITQHHDYGHTFQQFCNCVCNLKCCGHYQKSQLLSCNDLHVIFLGSGFNVFKHLSQKK